MNMFHWKGLFLGLLAFNPCVLGQGEGNGANDLGSVLASTKNLTTFNDLLRKYPEILLQLPGLDGVTIIAPSNQAFQNIPYTPLNEVWDDEDKETTISLLQYHVLPGTLRTSSLEAGPTYVRPSLLSGSDYANVTGGQNILFNKQSEEDVVVTTGLGTRSALVKRDIAFQGGVIHIVDNLLIPPARLDETAKAFQIPSFLGGLYAADLMPDVANRKSITVFAPQDTAFEAVGGTLEGLDADELVRVLGYHVIPDQVLVSANFTNGTRLKTLLRDGDKPQTVLIRQAGNNKYVNSAQIVQPDILIANGILHVIANVLNPDAESASPVPESATQPPVFDVSTVTDPFTSAIPCSTDCEVTTTATTSAPSGDTTDSDSADDGDDNETTTLATSSSDGAAAPARCTGHVAGAAALGIVGVGAGLAWL
ncbi:Fasciclin-like arabinogalactan protein [Paramyrothecium foliicola]|nr:Fasciclin-like arabinogalactan protein [Paramyrothecium foliicola]